MATSIIINRRQIESGEYRLVGKMAIKVSGDIEGHASGASDPIYVVSEREVAAGEFKVAAGRPIRMAAVRSSRQIRGKKATPVYVVSGTMSSAAWLPEDGLPGEFKIPLARFDFAIGQIGTGSMITEVRSVDDLHVLAQPSVLRAPWHSAGGLMTRNGYLVIPEPLRGKLAAIDMAGVAVFEELGDGFGGYDAPVRELIVYESISVSEMGVISQYVKHK